METERLMEVKTKCGQRHFKTLLCLIGIARFPSAPGMGIIPNSFPADMRESSS